MDFVAKRYYMKTLIIITLLGLSSTAYAMRGGDYGSRGFADRSDYNAARVLNNYDANHDGYYKRYGDYYRNGDVTLDWGVDPALGVWNNPYYPYDTDETENLDISQ